MPRPTNFRIPRDYRKLARAATEQGWAISLTGGGHLRWQAPSGALVFSSSSPGDVRSVRNFRSLLLRNGLKLDS